MAVTDGEGAVRLRVSEFVTEVDAEADSVRLLDVVLEDVVDKEEETVADKVLLRVDDADSDSDVVGERDADRLAEGLGDVEADREWDIVEVAEAEPGRLAERLGNTVILLVPIADIEIDTLLLIKTLRLSVELRVRQLRPP